MELVFNNTSTKRMLKEIMLELVREQQDFFYDIIRDVIEETGLAAAIREGRQNDFVTESEINAILEA